MVEMLKLAPWAGAARCGPRRSPELDDVTLRRAQQGERAALGRLIERYHPMVHALVWRMACAQGESHVADLVQDSLVRVLQGLSRFDPDGPARISTWILTITTRVVLNDRRRPPRGDARLEPSACIDPETAVADVELGSAIAKAVGELPEAQRIAFVLREYHDLDYSEIAKLLEADVGTIKSRLSRARAAVRDALARALPDLFRGDR
jgi:RNA polymerase sigma-70 factor (ECF subfamily)